MAKRHKFVYAVISMDVWGNPVDGWDVNNWYRSGAPLLEVTSTRSGSPDRADVLRALRRDGHLKAGIRDASLGMEWMDGGWSVTDERQPPLPANSNSASCPDYGWGKPAYLLEKVDPRDLAEIHRSAW